MSKRTIKPKTDLAKADAALTAEHRKINPKWDGDSVRFGVRVADYNAGWIAGSSKNKKRKTK